MRLFSYAIFLALASSDLCWTGTSSFSILGYSLGGGIGLNFISFFPQFVSHLILIAPSGLVRKEHISRTSRVLYSTGLLPEVLIEKFVMKRLGSNPSAAVAVKSKPIAPISMAVAEELPNQEQTHKDSTNSLSEMRPEMVARDAVVSRPCLSIFKDSVPRAERHLASGMAGPEPSGLCQGFHFKY